jgi:hypothetical protein
MTLIGLWRFISTRIKPEIEKGGGVTNRETLKLRSIKKVWGYFCKQNWWKNCEAKLTKSKLNLFI